MINELSLESPVLDTLVRLYNATTKDPMKRGMVLKTIQKLLEEKAAYLGEAGDFYLDIYQKRLVADAKELR